MTLDQLNAKLSFLDGQDGPVSLSMYILLQGGGIRSANLEEQARSELKIRFLSYLRRRLDMDDPNNYCPLTEHSDRKDAICYYDLEEVPEGLSAMSQVIQDEDRVEFSAGQDGFNNIEGFVFLIGNERSKVAIYKKHYPIALITQGPKFLSFGKSDTGLVQITDDILKISDKFEFLQIDQSLIVFSTNTLERYFGYDGILQTAARKNFDLISDAELIENIEELEELVTQKKFAKKMVAIKAQTPVLALPFDKIRQFILEHPKLKRRLKFNDSNDRIRFHSRKSKELFLDLLSDSYLKSELTELLYHSSIKDSLSNEEEED